MTMPKQIDKPWGHEIWFALTDRYAGKIITVRAGHRLSLQYHEHKDETSHLVSGRMIDFIEFDDGFAIVKMYPPKPIRGLSLSESHVRQKFGITVVGVKSPGKDFTYATADTIISNHDLIIASGSTVDLEKFASLQG